MTDRMNRQERNPAQSSTAESVTPAKAETPDQPYTPPHLVVIGRTKDLVQGGSGKHTDGYTGYYHNNEG